MALYYRLLGVIVAAGLAVSAALIWTSSPSCPRPRAWPCRSSGIAGIIVSVGVTVDSYVVFFERLKDEVRAGRSMRNSAQRGFAGAWHTILVADLVSLIGAAVLWYLTVGSVRSFAFFLGLSTLFDLLVAYFFTPAGGAAACQDRLDGAAQGDGHRGLARRQVRQEHRREHRRRACPPTSHPPRSRADACTTARPRSTSTAVGGGGSGSSAVADRHHDGLACSSRASTSASTSRAAWRGRSRRPT